MLRILGPSQPEIDFNQMKEDIQWLKSHGKKVMISLGGGVAVGGHAIREPKPGPVVEGAAVIRTTW